MFRIRLKELREARNLSQYSFAKHFGISQSTVGNWESGIRQPKTDVLERIAEFFNVSVDYLLGREEKRTSPSRRKGVKIPVYGSVAAGVPIEAINDFDAEDPDSWEEITEEMAASGSFFALRIKGDSMSPVICDGDIVIVRQQEDVESGETAIVMINGDDATCKRVIKQEHGIGLVANNPAYETRFYSTDDIINLPVRVIGKVVELRRSF